MPLHDTKETAEIIAAGSILYREIASLKDPSPFKLALALADDVPTIVSGLHGAHLVPAELADLSEDESAELERQLADKFQSHDSPAVQLAVQQSAKAVLAGILAVRAWRAVYANAGSGDNVVPFPQPQPPAEGATA